MRVSKNGSDFFEIDDTPDSIDAAKAKGYKPFMQVTKNGIDIFEIEDSPDSFSAAQSKGYDQLESYATKRAAEKFDSTPSKADSRILGFAKGSSGDFIDEIAGGLEAVGSKVGVRGLGGSFSDIRLETDEEDKKGFKDVYREGRDKKKADLKAAYDANPGNFIASNLLGGVGLGAALPAGKALTTAAKVGGIMGLGASDADLTRPGLEAYWEAGKDTATGALTGALTQGALNTGGSIIKAAKNYTPTAIESFKESSGLTLLGKGYDALSAVVSQHKNTGAYKSMVERSKDAYLKNLTRMVDEGGGGNADESLRAARSILDKMSDEEYVLKAIKDGDPEVTKWIAAKQGQSTGANGVPEQFEKLNAIGIDARNEARNFNKKTEALNLKPIVDDAITSFDEAVSEKVAKHTRHAKNAFDGDLKNVQDKVMSAYEDSVKNKALVKDGVAARIDAANKALDKGDTLSEFDLAEGPLSFATNQSKFERLQTMRQILDDGIDYEAVDSGRRGYTEGERILKRLRDRVDEALKAAPQKREADEAARAGYKLNKDLFGAAEFRGGVDEFKIETLLGDNPTAGRFKNAMEKYEQWAADESINPEAREKAAKMASEMKRLFKVADDKRAIDAFQYKGGPSSAAIQGLKSSLKGQDLIEELIASPTVAMSKLDNFSVDLKRLTGKSWTEMNEAEKAAAIKLRIWANKETNRNLAPTDEAMIENFGKFMKYPKKWNAANLRYNEER